MSCHFQLLKILYSVLRHFQHQQCIQNEFNSCITLGRNDMKKCTRAHTHTYTNKKDKSTHSLHCFNANLLFCSECYLTKQITKTTQNNEKNKQKKQHRHETIRCKRNGKKIKNTKYVYEKALCDLMSRTP